MLWSEADTYRWFLEELQMTYIEGVLEFLLDDMTSAQRDEFVSIYGHVVPREQINAAMIWCEQKTEENKKCGT